LLFWQFYLDEFDFTGSLIYYPVSDRNLIAQESSSNRSDDTYFYYYSGATSYAEDFSKLCAGNDTSYGIPTGCAIFSVEFQGQIVKHFLFLEMDLRMILLQKTHYIILKLWNMAQVILQPTSSKYVFLIFSITDFIHLLFVIVKKT
jgi:hypothetical protein